MFIMLSRCLLIRCIVQLFLLTFFALCSYYNTIYCNFQVFYRGKSPCLLDRGISCFNGVISPDYWPQVGVMLSIRELLIGMSFPFVKPNAHARIDSGVSCGASSSVSI